MRGKGPITYREMQVLSMLAEHRTYAHIAANMGINVVTVYNHVASLMLKTGMHKKELLIKYAIDHGFRKQVISA